MEAFAAISLTGNILQFVEFSSKLVSASREIGKSGNTSEYVELESDVKELQGFLSRLKKPESSDADSYSLEEESLRTLADKCVGVTTDLLNVLSKIRSKDPQNKFRNFHSALKAEWRRDEIEKLEKRLDSIKQSILMQANDFDQKKLLRKLEDLSQENRSLHASRGEDIERLRKCIEELMTKKEDGVFRLAENALRPRPLLDIADKGFTYSADFFVLDQLRFDKINNRFDLIETPHERTLSWVYSGGRDTPNLNEPLNFREWLVSSHDLYWISGKPGSGKSTLMKHLSTCKISIELLEEWTQGERLITAAYFFWDASQNHLQKSQEGLLRTLIYQILKERPDLIRQVYMYPNCHLEVESGRGLTEGKARFYYDGLSTDVKLLITVLQEISKLLIRDSTKLCLFIDGLDEYHGDLHELLCCINNLRQLGNAKICVSSRPWNEFKAAFARNNIWQLHMQDYNRTDIGYYVQDKLEATEEFQRVKGKEIEGKLLVKEVLDASNGVFLWVVLVVKSLKEGILNGDSFQTLRRRLESYPKDLDGFFQVILSHVSVFYLQRTAQWFSVIINAGASLPVALLWLIDFGESDDILEGEYRQLNDNEMSARLTDMEKRLDASSKGLLETSQKRHKIPIMRNEYLFREVVFLHRTVREFLIQPGTQALLNSWDKSEFNLHRAICVAVIKYLASAPVRDPDCKGVILDLFQILTIHFPKIASSDHPEPLPARLFEAMAANIMNPDRLICRDTFFSALKLYIRETITVNSAAYLVDVLACHMIHNFNSSYLSLGHKKRNKKWYSILTYLSMIVLDVETVRRLLSNTTSIMDWRLQGIDIWSLFWARMYYKHNLAVQSNILPTYDGLDKESAYKLTSIMELALARKATDGKMVVPFCGDKEVTLLDFVNRLMPSDYGARARELLLHRPALFEPDSQTIHSTISIQQTPDPPTPGSRTKPSRLSESRRIKSINPLSSVKPVLRRLVGKFSSDTSIRE